MHALVVGEVAREGDDGGEAEEEDQRVELQGLEGHARGGARRPDLERQQPEAERPREGAVRLFYLLGGKVVVEEQSGHRLTDEWRERPWHGMAWQVYAMQEARNAP